MSLNVLNIHRRVFVCGATATRIRPHSCPGGGDPHLPAFCRSPPDGPTVQGGELLFEVDKAPVGIKG